MNTEDRLLAEDLLLLAWDHDAGKPRSTISVQLPVAVGGALLLELARRDRLRMEEKVPRASSRPTGDPLLDSVAAQMRNGSRRRKLKSWVRKIGTTGTRDQVRDRLVGRGVLVPAEQRVLGIVPVTRYRAADPAEVERLADEVRAVLTGGGPADDRVTALVALVGATAVLDRLVPRGGRRAARARAKELAEAMPVAAAVRDVIRETQAA
ncbi:MAG: GOLPH3/VPS74 family protein, partial [Nitriliruptoraceae bacterium]